MRLARLLLATFGILCIPTACALAGEGPPAPASDDGFWRTWGDGKAEIDGYALVQPRYGEPRAGTAVLIFVTEDFSDSARVKADPGKHPPADVYPVLKLNFTRQFQTGIYQYNVLTSVFARTEFRGSGASWPLTKVSFSAQEWCGHVYQQWLARGQRLVGQLHSYFDGEADAALELPLPPGGVLEDALPILVRGLRGDWLAPGESRPVPLLPSSLRARLLHRKQAWGQAIVRRSSATAPVATALGTLPAFTYTIEEQGGDTLTYTIEAAQPHRILAWQSSSGESGKILGSARLPYWMMNKPGGEAALKDIGLAPLPSSQPLPSR
ncbi:MAG TPA: hypothetical protein VH877_26925 [Polyangia bacterium]|jgi:hypothetical protein|nr:hypothetical protein [Polyangia bacterium]